MTPGAVQHGACSICWVASLSGMFQGLREVLSHEISND